MQSWISLPSRLCCGRVTVPQIIYPHWSSRSWSTTFCCWKLVQQPIERLRSIGIHAISDLQRTAQELGKTDAPSRKARSVIAGHAVLHWLPSVISVGDGNSSEKHRPLRIKTSLRDSVVRSEDELHLSEWPSRSGASRLSGTGSPHQLLCRRLSCTDSPHEWSFG